MGQNCYHLDQGYDKRILGFNKVSVKCIFRNNLVLII
ncbi:MAG: hypothetical protein RIR11_67 [Bacteroidota bacterium]|jgi:hypothetical protein